MRGDQHWSPLIRVEDEVDVVHDFLHTPSTIGMVGDVRTLGIPRCAKDYGNITT
jgi:hypothetical protein